MKNLNIVKREITQTNYETIINGVRFTLAQILNTKKYAIKKQKESKIKYQWLCFDLKTGYIGIE